MTALYASKTLGWFVAATFLFGCQGGSIDDSVAGGASSGGASSGGASSGGANLGGRNAGGTTAQSGAGGMTVCCAAAAVCNAGDQQIADKNACPSGANCYSNSICCSTVWCATASVQCDAMPTCDSGDTTLTGACPTDVACYTRSLCGSTVYCLDTACDPASEYNRDYKAKSPEQCARIDFRCPANTVGFSNTCGCGCEQSSTCPQTLDCMPGGAVDPRCADGTLCPYTLRAL